MRNFIKYLLLGVLLPACAMLAVVETLAQLYPNTYRYKHNFVTQRGNEIKTLVLGTSRAYYGIDPELLEDSSFNLANVSQVLYIDSWLLKKHLPDMSQLRTVILEVNNCSIVGFKDMGDGPSWYRLIYYNLYMDYPVPLFSKCHFEICNYHNAKRKVGHLLHDIGTNSCKVLCNERGWGTEYAKPLDFTPETLHKSAVSAAKRHDHTSRSNYDSSMQALEEIATCCKEHNIRLILVALPISAAFREVANPEQFKYLATGMEYLSNKYGVEYLDYMNDPRFEGKDYYDTDHLSRQGAEKFTAILKEDIHL